jgi:rhodanese-related sulfurtransferase
MNIRNRITTSLSTLLAVAFLAGCQTAPQAKPEAAVQQTVAAAKQVVKGDGLPAGVTNITVDELKALVEKGPEAGNYLLFDSRPADRFNSATIPYSGHLTDADMAKLDAEGNVASRLGNDKNKEMIFWCGGPACGFSKKAAGLAVKNGYNNTRVFLGGDPAWAKAELPFVSSPKFVKDAINIMLIDLRSADKFAAGHIPRAVNLPTADLGKYPEANWPAFKSAPIVFYSDNQEEIDTALELMGDYALTKATYFPGGFERWQQLGNAVETGPKPAPAKLTFVKVLEPHHIAIADFIKALDNPDVVILDVRTDAERQAGSFKGAIHIPSDQIPLRYAELPKDKQILIHCVSGGRAGVSYITLKAKGFSNMKVLNASVKFENGNYKITE